MKKIVMVPETLDERKKSWRKLLEGVDKEKANGYAFVGEWLKAGERAELEVGSFILCYDEAGSMKNWYPVVRMFKVGVETHAQGQIHGRCRSAAVPQDKLIDFAGNDLLNGPRMKLRRDLPVSDGQRRVR